MQSFVFLYLCMVNGDCIVGKKTKLSSRWLIFFLAEVKMSFCGGHLTFGQILKIMILKQNLGISKISEFQKNLELIKMEENNSLRIGQINACSMQGGVVLGVFGILSLVVFRWSFVVPFLSTLFGVMLLATPVLATFLTLRYRNLNYGEREPFSFVHGFLYAVFTGFYASVWVALFTYVYLQFFDHGRIFADYAHSINTPEMKAYLMQSGLDAEISQLSGGHGVKGLVDAMQSVGAATYAAMSIYFALIFGPVISAVIGFVTRRG